MKKLITLLILLAISAPSIAGDWCSGFRDGYRDSYRNEKGIIPPSPPCPPIPPLHPGAPSDPYQRGYLEGAKEALRAALR